MYGRWGEGYLLLADGRRLVNQHSRLKPPSSLHFLSDQPGYRPAPYLASRGMKWIQQYDVPGTEDDELIYYLTESHRIVSLGLTKKKQKELDLNQD